jgi:hypothetical protein
MQHNQIVNYTHINNNKKNKYKIRDWSNCF